MESFLGLEIYHGIAWVLPWVPEVFLACGGNFPCWPKAEATSGEAARKTSGTERCFLLSPLTFELFLSDYIYANQIESLRL